MSETKPVCNRDAALPYEQADTATCPHCGNTAREHWIARTEENVAQLERQSALASARDEVVSAALAHCEATHEGYAAKPDECAHPLCAAVANLAKLEETK